MAKPVETEHPWNNIFYEEKTGLICNDSKYSKKTKDLSVS